MHQQTWQIQQQLQRVQQLCAETAQVSQQVVQEIQHIHQQVGQLSSATTQNMGVIPQQAAYGNYPNQALNAVMQADRTAGIQENTPSYRNYNTQVPQYSPSQSVNFNTPYSSFASTSASSPVQAVLTADYQANATSNRPQYGGYTSSSIGQNVGGYSSVMM